MRIELAGICKFDAENIENAADFEIQNPVDKREKSNYTREMKTKKKALIATACLAVYFGAYFLLVHPMLAGPPEHHVRFETYIAPLTRCQAPQNTSLRLVFWPAHKIDVLVRHGFWFPT